MKKATGLYYDIESNLHALDARVKLPAAFILILLISALAQSAWPVMLFIIFIILGLQIASEIPFVVLYGRSLIVLPFLLAAIPVLFTADGPPLLTFNLFHHVFAIAPAGLEHFVSIFLKSWLSVQVAILLAATTPMMELLNALRVYHVPKTIVMVFRLMWRYLSIMFGKAQRMMRARAARSVYRYDTLVPRHSFQRFSWQAQVTGSMAGSLFMQSLEQSERVYYAMLSRGFDGEIRLLPQPGLSGKQKIIILLWILFCLILFLLGTLFG